VLGAGGSARAAVWALTQAGTDVAIHNRTPERAVARTRARRPRNRDPGARRPARQLHRRRPRGPRREPGRPHRLAGRRRPRLRRPRDRAHPRRPRRRRRHRRRPGDPRAPRRAVVLALDRRARPAGRHAGRRARRVGCAAPFRRKEAPRCTRTSPTSPTRS
jgi:hypothetical protein